VHRKSVRVSRGGCALPILVAALLLIAAGPDATRARALAFQPQLGMPAEALNMVGVAPGEQGGPTFWATGGIGSVPVAVEGLTLKKADVLLRRAQAGGWQIVPVLGVKQEQLSFTGSPSVSYDGDIVLLSSDAADHQTVLTRAAGGPFEVAPAPSGEGAGAVLEKGESLYPSASSGSPIFTAIDESPSQVGALVVPASLSAEDPGVLHYDSAGATWTREPICAGTTLSAGACATPATGLTPLAIAASSPQNAWLLAAQSEKLELFKRELAPGAATPVWVESQPADLTPWAQASEKDEVVPRASGQMLTVTSRGVWIDAALDTPTTHHADISLLVSTAAPSEVEGTWCYPQSVCKQEQGGHEQGSLGAPLPEEYRSFAWPEPGEDGTRLIVGLEEGALLRLQGSGNFAYEVGWGGDGSADAEFSSPEEGWVSQAGSSNSGQLVHVTSTGAAAGASAEAELCELHQLCAWPLTFRRPLLAIAQQPGTPAGDPNAEVLAVGDQGQVARYKPGQGWVPEFLYTASGQVATPTLRGVAWPEPNRAYAVGDEGAMWLWNAETGLWEPDPAAPLGLHDNFTAIAFSPSDPTLGYAVGKQGALLAYDKTWTQQRLPPGLEAADFTSVAFAGTEALATYRLVNAADEEEGGLLVSNEGGEWQVEPQMQKLLAGLGAPRATVLSKVAGLPDGGTVVAGPGLVIERDNVSSPWHFSPQPLPEAQNIAALAAIEAGSHVQALVSVDLNELSNPNNLTNIFRAKDAPQEPGFGQPATLIEPDPLPITGYLLRQSASGEWEDLEQQAYPFPAGSSTGSDLPDWPDAVLALDVNQSGSEGWAVGGQTGSLIELSRLTAYRLESQTAVALRLGEGGAAPRQSTAMVLAPSGTATFALGGNAQCSTPCVALANEHPGPDAWLSGAVARAAQIGGLRAFLYSGARVAPAVGRTLEPAAFEREEGAYAEDLREGEREGGKNLETFAHVAASPSDLNAAGSVGTFTSELGGFMVGQEKEPAGGAPPPAGTAAYAFESQGEGGPVWVIVLDFSASSLPEGEREWLEKELVLASESGPEKKGDPAIVLGNADVVDSAAPNRAADGVAVQKALLEPQGKKDASASAYLFDSENENVQESIGPSNRKVEVLGSGTLGYVPPSPRPEEFLGASGFLLVSVHVGERNKATNIAPVTASLLPNISQLALDPTDGTLLRRSQVALFKGLARRPHGGLELEGSSTASSSAVLEPNPYVPIPDECNGPDCAQFVAPKYTFTVRNTTEEHSKENKEEEKEYDRNPQYGGFVERERNSSNLHAVKQNAEGKPIPDEPRYASGEHKGELTPNREFEKNSKGEPINERGEVVEPEESGTFCAYNPTRKERPMTVTVEAGGLSYTEEVTIQGGSVEQPCGTVVLAHPPAVEAKASAAVSPLPPSSPPASAPAPVAVVPPPPAAAPPPPPAPPAPLAKAPPPPPPFFFTPLPAVPPLAVVLPPPPVLARPIPPSGTAPVTVVSPAVAPEEKREDEEAVESARNSMAVYEPDNPHLPPLVPLALIVLAAGAGASLRRTGRARRPRRVTPALARAERGRRGR
jgi:hypothetical protein